jgi:phage terminase small subunit
MAAAKNTALGTNATSETECIKSGGDDLMMTDKQRRFAEEYAKDLNVTRAYMTVYKNCKNSQSASASGCRLLNNASVAAHVQEMQRVATEKAQITVDQVVKDLVEVKDRCMQAVPVQVWDSEQHAYVPSESEFQFDSKGANTALKLLGDHLGMFQKKVEVSGSLDTSQAKVDAVIDQLKQGDDES